MMQKLQRLFLESLILLGLGTCLAESRFPANSYLIPPFTGLLAKKLFMHRVGGGGALIRLKSVRYRPIYVPLPQ